MKQLIRKILKEETLKQNLIDVIEKYGYLDAVEIVGGVKNLMDIIGEEKITDLLMSCFTDLNVIKRGGDIILRDNHLHILENKSSWGLPLIVYNNSIEIRILLKLGEDMVELYRNVRRNFIKELVNRFPELYVEDVDVFTDSGLYIKLDSFKL
jgi:hypothetical protein